MEDEGRNEVSSDVQFELNLLIGLNLQALQDEELSSDDQEQLLAAATAVRLGWTKLGGTISANSRKVCQENPGIYQHFPGLNSRFSEEPGDPMDPNLDGLGRTPVLGRPSLGQITLDEQFVEDERLDPMTWLNVLSKWAKRVHSISNTRFQFKLRGKQCLAGFKTLSRCVSKTELKRVRRHLIDKFGQRVARKLEWALKQKRRTRSEQLITGVQDALIIATQGECLFPVDRWHKFRCWLLRTAFYEKSVSNFAKRIKRFVGAVEDSLVQNILHADPHQMLRELLESDSEIRIHLYPLVQKFCPGSDTFTSREEAWFLGHISQTRYLPATSRGEAMESMISAQERLLSNSTMHTYTSQTAANGAVYWTKSKERLATDHPKNSASYERSKETAYLAGQLVGDYAKKRFSQDAIRRGKAQEGPTESHLSLSGSACLEYARTEGGKWAICWNEFKDFLLSPIDELGLETKSYQTGLDQVSTYYVDMLGNKVSSLENSGLPLWRAAYLDEVLEGDFLSPHMIESKAGDIIAEIPIGIDQRLGQLLFFWASLQYVFWKEEGGKPPRIEMVPIMEPGVKSRIATKCTVWINLFLAPAGHYLRDMLINVPGCRISMQGANHLWELENSWGRHCAEEYWANIYNRCNVLAQALREGKYKHGRCSGDARQAEWAMTSSDLETATDHLDHQIEISRMTGFIEGFNPPEEVASYLETAVRLHLSPRELTNPFRTTKSRYERKLHERWERNAERLGTSTRKGALMGEPIAKMVLTLLSLSADFYSRILTGLRPDQMHGWNIVNPDDQYEFVPTRWSILNLWELTAKNLRKTKGMFACAGDDHTAPGPVSFLKNISLTLDFWAAVVSEDKYQISSKYVHYCQDYAYVFRPLQKPYQARELGCVFKLDIIMMRLLSDARKTSPQCFEEPDPHPGKMKDLTERLMWIGRGQDDRTEFFREGSVLSLRRLQFFDLILLLYSQGLGNYAPARYLKDPRSFIAGAKGGRGYPYLESLETILEPWIRWMVTADTPASKAVARGTNTKRTRGIVMAEETMDATLADKLQLDTFTYGEIYEQEVAFSPHSDTSRTNVSAAILKNYTPITQLEHIELKVRTHARVFELGAKSLQTDKKFVTYFSRQRSVAKLGQAGYDVFLTDAVGDYSRFEPEQVKLAMARFPQDTQEYVRREDVARLFPKYRLPSLTLPLRYLSGGQNLLSLEYDLKQSEVTWAPLEDAFLVTSHRLERPWVSPCGKSTSAQLADGADRNLKVSGRPASSPSAYLAADPELTGISDTSSRRGGSSTATWCHSISRFIGF